MQQFIAQGQGAVKLPILKACNPGRRGSATSRLNQFKPHPIRCAASGTLKGFLLATRRSLYVLFENRFAHFQLFFANPSPSSQRASPWLSGKTQKSRQTTPQPTQVRRGLPCGSPINRFSQEPSARKLRFQLLGLSVMPSAPASPPRLQGVFASDDGLV